MAFYGALGACWYGLWAVFPAASTQKLPAPSVVLQLEGPPNRQHANMTLRAGTFDSFLDHRVMQKDYGAAGSSYPKSPHLPT